MNGKICPVKGGTSIVGKATTQALAHGQGIPSICDRFPACKAIDERAREHSVNYEGRDQLLIIGASK